MEPEGTVFIVDDDAEVRRALTRLLASVDLSCRTFSSAEEFLKAYGPNGPACLVLDVRMPGISGIELHRQLAAKGMTIPVIIVTGHGDTPMAVEAIQRGAVGFLEKPVKPQQFLDCVRRALIQDAQRRRT